MTPCYCYCTVTVCTHTIPIVCWEKELDSTKTMSEKKRQRTGDVSLIGYHGAEASFTCVAARRYFEKYASTYGAEFEASGSLKDIFDRLKNGSLTYGVIPVESSSNGTLNGSYDFILRSSSEISIVGETIEKEVHCLCAISAIDESAIYKVMSHPVLVQDCSHFLDKLDEKRAKQGQPPIDRMAVHDSAIACRQLTAAPDSTGIAVICTQQAAALYGLTVICQAVGNDRNSETRYAILSKSDPINLSQVGGMTGPGNTLKASVAVTIKNAPGSMYRMIACFGLRDINIINIERRPASTAVGFLNLSRSGEEIRHWDTIFFIDYEPSSDEAVNEALMNNLTEFSMWLRPLGRYRRCGQAHTVTVLSDWGNMVDILATA